jgi:23S rRNA (adenine2503-C2)-methyltransferase
MLALSTAHDTALCDVLAAHGAPAWRARQLRRAAWRPQVSSFAEIADLPVALRQALAEEIRFSTVTVAGESPADQGLTFKLLARLPDGATVETVAMETPARGQSGRRSTICVSSQVGCAVGCPFCATGQLGLIRSCSAAEIVDQVRAAAAALTRHGLGPVTHVVYMGMGEPLLNSEATIESLRTLVRAGLSARRLTVSTSGVVPGIERLATTGLPVTLAISLHAATDDLRDRLVPLNRAYPLEQVLAAGTRYVTTRGRRLTFEWCLIGGVNDSLEQARMLRNLAREAHAHVNVIPMNRIDGSPWGPPSPAAARRFLAGLDGVRVTVRDTRGAESDAACGQLRAALERRRELRADGTLGPMKRPGAPGSRHAAGS